MKAGPIKTPDIIKTPGHPPMPGPHLTEQEAEHATRSYWAYTNRPADYSHGTFTLAYLHIRQGQPVITLQVEIPRYESNMDSAARASSVETCM